MPEHLRADRLRGSPAAPASWSARPVRCCSSLTAFSVCRMLSAAESTWLLRKSGSCRLTAISASAWILPSMRSSSIETNSAFFFARAVVVEPQLRHRDAVLQRADDALVAAALRGRETLAQLGEARRRSPARSSSAGTDRARPSTAAAAGTARAADRGRRADVLGAAGVIAGARRARRRRCSRISRQRACRRSKRVRASAGSPPSIATSDTRRRRRRAAGVARPGRAAWTLASIAARKRGTETRPAR